MVDPKLVCLQPNWLDHIALALHPRWGIAL